MKETMKAYVKDGKNWVLEYEQDDKDFVHKTLEDCLIWKFLAHSKDYKRITNKLHPGGYRVITVIGSNDSKLVFTIKAG